jgi:hypothetical protein
VSARYKPRSYSDTTPVIEERKRGGNHLTDPGQRVSAPSVSDDDRALARQGLIRRGAVDVVEILGLGEEACPAGALAVACPTCSRPVGSKCRATAGGGPMNRSHVARTLAADAAGHEDQARAELLAESTGG